MRLPKILLTLILALASAATATAQEFVCNGVKYRLLPATPDQAVLVEDTVSTDTVRIPAYVDYEGRPRRVVKIAWHAFWNARPGIRGYEIPQTVDTLEGGWMDGNGGNVDYLNVHPLNSSYMSDGNVIYNRYVTELVKYAPLRPDTVFFVPATVRQINTSAFAGCPYLRRVVLPTNLHVILHWAFSSCPNLSDINVPPYLLVVSENSFSNCPKLPAAFVADPIQYGRNKAAQEKKNPGLSELSRMYLLFYGNRNINAAPAETDKKP